MERICGRMAADNAYEVLERQVGRRNALAAKMHVDVGEQFEQIDPDHPDPGGREASRWARGRHASGQTYSRPINSSTIKISTTTPRPPLGA